MRKFKILPLLLLLLTLATSAAAQKKTQKTCISHGATANSSFLKKDVI